MRHYNIFRSLTAFELLLPPIENKRKFLSILYGILLPDSSVDDKVKARWEKDLGSSGILEVH